MIGKTNARGGVSAPVPKIKTVSGSVISISNALAQAAESLIVDINAVQSGSGDPSPSNVRPISGWSAVKVARTGKNLLPTAGYTNTTRTALNSSMCAEVAEIVVGKSDSFVISGTTTAVQSDANFITFYFEYTDETNSSTVIYRGDQHSSGAVTGAWSAVSTAGKTISSVRLGGNTGSAKVTLSELQLELGSTATAYEPYNGNTYTIQLGQTVYGGSLDVTTGVLTVEYVKQTITAFNNIWSGSYSNGTPAYAVIANSTHVLTQINPAMMKSNIFTYTTLSRSSAPLLSYGGNDGGNTTQTFVLPSSITTLAEANAWLSSLSEPLECTFKLATSQTVQLTPTEVQMLLGNNVLWADSGDSELQYWARR